MSVERRKVGAMAGRVRWLLAVVLGSLVLVEASPIFPESSGLSSLGQRLLEVRPAEGHLLDSRQGEGRQLDSRPAEGRLPPLPSPQDLEAIRKVAQILVMLGEQHSQRDAQQVVALNSLVDLLRSIKHRPASQRKLRKVIPAITGDGGGGVLLPHPIAPATAAAAAAATAVDEVPNDPVEE